jgi:AraC-like DNA-binding protein
MQLVKNINGSDMNAVFNENGNSEKTNATHSPFFSDEEMSRIDSVVRRFLTEKQPFLQRGYSLRRLSEDIRLPLHHLSAFINRQYQMNFNGLINRYRVDYCKIKIMNYEWRVKKLEAIGEESGFSNRNTFTTAFKKVTGLNPSDYLKRIKGSQHALSHKTIDLNK